MLSEHDKAHIDDIMGGHGDWFTAKLLRLCAKADSKNLEKIRLGFPEVVEAYEKWFYLEGAYDEGPYPISDPKHPDHHDVYADVYDAREGK